MGHLMSLESDPSNVRPRGHCPALRILGDDLPTKSDAYSTWENLCKSGTFSPASANTTRGIGSGQKSRHAIESPQSWDLRLFPGSRRWHYEGPARALQKMMGVAPKAPEATSIASTHRSRKSLQLLCQLSRAPTSQSQAAPNFYTNF